MLVVGFAPEGTVGCEWLVFVVVRNGGVDGVSDDGGVDDDVNDGDNWEWHSVFLFYLVVC